MPTHCHDALDICSDCRGLRQITMLAAGLLFSANLLLVTMLVLPVIEFFTATPAMSEPAMRHTVEPDPLRRIPSRFFAP